MRRLICVLVLTVPLLAGDPKPATAPAAAKETAAAQKTAQPIPKQTAAGGMVVQIENDTVVRNPDLSTDVQEALAQMINTSSEGLVQETLADGTVVVDLEGRFQSAMVATINADGKAVGHCLSKDPKHQCAQHQKPPQAAAAPKKQ